MNNDQKIDISATVVRQTVQAMLMNVQGREVWIPKSLMDDSGRKYIYRIPRWFALKNGLCK